jgi:hypothetical protein
MVLGDNVVLVMGEVSVGLDASTGGMVELHTLPDLPDQQATAAEGAVLTPNGVVLFSAHDVRRVG